MKQHEVVKPPKMNKQAQIMNEVRNEAIHGFANHLMNDVKATHKDNISLDELEEKVKSVRQSMLFQLEDK